MRTHITRTEHNAVAPDRARRRLIGGLIAGAAAGLAGPVLAATAPARATEERFEVEIARDGSAVRVRIQAEVAASADQVFATLIDYDHLADFIPGLAASRTVGRTGNRAQVEQRGRASFGPFEQRFAVALAVEEAPGEWVHATLAGGDFRQFDARYDLTAVDGGKTRIDYRAAMEPTAGVPPLVGVPIMRGMVRRQFAALIDEIARRASL